MLLRYYYDALVCNKRVLPIIRCCLSRHGFAQTITTIKMLSAFPEVDLSVVGSTVLKRTDDAGSFAYTCALSLFVGVSLSPYQH